MTIIMGIDIGGTGIKGALVDVDQGKLVSERYRLPTPSDRTPQAVIPVVAEVAAHFQKDPTLNYTGIAGVGFPSVVVNGVPKSPFTAHQIKDWIAQPIGQQISQAISAPVTMINDADAAGIAEIKFGAGRNQNGVVILLTLGTGIGSALFIDGKLVPNTEFGKLRLPGRSKTAELYAAERIRIEKKQKWKEWAVYLDEYLRELERLFTPQLFILGGGAAKKHQKFIPRLTVQTPVVPAELRNEAGIVGAAMAAIQ